MSRIRSVHPGLWTDVEFVGLSAFARLLFIGIWNECDDQGTFVWSPLQLKMRLLPADNLDAAELLSEIEQASAILRYEIAGKAYGAVRNFTKFQRPKKPNKVNPTTPEILAFAGGTADARDGDAGDDGSEPSEDKLDQVPNQLPTDGGKSPQREDGGEDGGGSGNEEEPTGSPSPVRGKSSKASRIEASWKPAPLPPTVAELVAQWPPKRANRELEGFVDYWLSRSKDAARADWDKTWHNRIRDIHDRVIRDNRNGQFSQSPRESTFDTGRRIADELFAASQSG